MPLISTFRVRAGRGKGIGAGSSQILPQVGPFANHAPVVASQQANVTIGNAQIIQVPATTASSPQIAKNYTINGDVSNQGVVDLGTLGRFYLWCDKFTQNGVIGYGQNVLFPSGSAASAGAAGAGSAGIFGGGSGAAANTTVGTYQGGAPGSPAHVNGFQGQIADGYTTGAAGVGVATANILPSNYSLQSALPKSGKGGNVTIGAFTSGAGGGGGACPGIICIVCNTFQYNPSISYFAMIPSIGGLSGNGAGNGGDAGDTGVMIFMTKAKVTSGGDVGPPNFNFDISATSGGGGGIHGVAGKNGAFGRFQFWEIKRDNTLVYHWNPKDTWNNL